MAVSRLGNRLVASLVIARASKQGFKRNGASLSLRWASSAAVQAKPRSAPAPALEDIDVVEETDSVGEDQPTFSTLEGRVSQHTLNAVTGNPFRLTNMSPVQAAVLPLLPELARPYDPKDTSGPARDLLVKARTGTGKTLGFLIPALEAREKALDAHAKQAAIDAGSPTDRHLMDRAKRAMARSQVGALILSPTRELATQIAKEAIKLSSHHPGFEVRLFVGGESKRQQMREWTRGNKDIVVGTPGRIRDVLENEPMVAEGLARTKMLILDEADTLLDMGFRSEIDAIAKFIRPTPERQTFMFSATVSKGIRDIAREILDRNHTFVNCVSDDAPPVHAHIPQHYTVLPDATEQLPHVLRLLAHDQLTNPGKSKTILFLPTTKLTKLYATILREMSRSLPAEQRTRVYEIHSMLTQPARTRTSDNFRRDSSGASILVSSDVSARGVDYPGVTRVIQIGVPGTSDQYVHRVGRTGRGSEKRGRADLVLLPFEAGFVRWQLNAIPIQALETTQLQSEVEELAKSHDSGHQDFLKQASQHNSRFYTTPQSASLLQGLDQSLAALYDQIDPEAARDTVASLLGYYASKTQDMRCSRTDVLEGLKDWSMKACGLKEPPHFSEAFLTKVGMSGQGRGQRNQGPPRRTFGLARNDDKSWGSRDGGFGERTRPPRDSSFGERTRAPRDSGFGESTRAPRNDDFGDRSRGRRDAPWEQRGQRGPSRERTYGRD